MRISFLITILLVACKANRNGNSQKLSVVQEMPITHIAHDNYGGTAEESTLVIKDAKRLQKFYSEVNKTRKPGLPVPEIDFTREMVLIFCSGETKNGQAPNLSIAEEGLDTIHIEVEKNTAKNHVSSAVIYPFSVYKMPLTDKVISFQ